MKSTTKKASCSASSGEAKFTTTTLKVEMKLPEIVAAAFYVAIAVFSLYYGAKVISMEPQIPCGVAEISPDFSAEDRARCRQQRGHKL